MEDIINEVMPKIGVYFEEYKDIYHVKVVLLLRTSVLMIKSLSYLT